MKTKIFTIITFLLIQPLPAFSATLKVNNGVPCDKSGSTINVKGEKYICGKNSFIQSNKNIWIWDGCIIVTKNYSEKLAEVNELKKKSSNKKQININNAEIALNYLKSVAKESCKKGV